MLGFERCCFIHRDNVGNEPAFPSAALQGLQVPGGGPGPAETTDAESRRSARRSARTADLSFRSVGSGTSARTGASLDEEQKAREMAKLQHTVRDFVTEFLQGVFLDAVLEDGSLVPCQCMMDSKFQRIVLKVHATTRQLELGNISEICSGKELRDLHVTTPLDENCVTLVMADDQCVSFKFGDVKARERFATSIKVLRLALEE